MSQLGVEHDNFDEGQRIRSRLAAIDAELGQLAADRFRLPEGAADASVRYQIEKLEAERKEIRTHSLFIFPEWGDREVVGESIVISPDLRKRFRAWNQTWQVVLDPVLEINWPDPEAGRQWIAEGNALVQDLQHEIGTKYRVVGDFAAYAPDA
ncbi:hypothetical protein FHX49_001495 [Microbacterium endophyticum]|uniref:Uncharacterized protein n=1 Tax=Microbacterium endophyticum TaxID=1526412 RepID=A0A7W4V301_9MICO|nr:hypothetical protein [Microbacterium endophyticum]MBB2975928.1 hypothetical protein [Microbacterium endophyticum]NIK37703.1 hypothetical protein [Microbacterium endophyticum]